MLVGDRTQPLLKKRPAVVMDEISVYWGKVGGVSKWVHREKLNCFGRWVIVIVGCLVAGRVWEIQTIVDTTDA